MPKPLDNPIPGGKFNEEIERKRLRDQFAGRAMEGLMGRLELIDSIAQARGMTAENYIGITAYGIADGMMKARDGK